MTSARTARRRQALARLGIRHGHLGSNGKEAEQEEGGAAKESGVRDMEVVAEPQIVCSRVEEWASAAGDGGEAPTCGGGGSLGPEEGGARAGDSYRLRRPAAYSVAAARRREAAGQGGGGACARDEQVSV